MMSDATRALLRNQRVLLVTQVLEMGGAERQALYLARYLKDEIGSEVHFWGMGVPGLVLERCREWGIQCRLVPVAWREGLRTFASGALGFLTECRGLRPTIVLPYTHPANLLCALTWRLAGARVCIWNQRDAGLHRFPLWVEQLAVRSTPFFVANSVAGAAFLRESLGVSEGLTRIVRNGVPVVHEPVSRQSARLGLQLPEDALVACMVANFHTGKDHETLIKAWVQVRAALAAAGRSSALVLVGHDYGTQGELVRLAADLGLSPLDVRFAGQMGDPGGLLNAVNLCVHSTRSEQSEGCPNAVLEAMSFGLAVVGSDVATMRETLGENAASCLAPLADVGALTDRICRFLLDDRLRSRIGWENRDRARRVFSLDRMYAKMADLMVSAVQASRPYAPG